ncbi:MAG: hypothetical protein HY308_17550 [Gammaproteobacteria bacterium]|nr:hypothetical protein [Gammaproteobacteria bacterium]
MNAATENRIDRLYELMPAVYRMRDAEQGYPLRAFLQVIAEQVNVLEDDIAQLYENWFIETCQDWVVPYIGSLIGYQPSLDIGEPANALDARRQARNRLLLPRREVAKTIRYRRRKGTVRMLEELAAAVAEWPARAVEFYRLLGVTQNINYLHLNRGRTIDLRDGDALENLDGPFDESAHTVDIRRVNSKHFPGRGNISDVGVFIWRLRPYTVTRAPAYCYEEQSPNCYLFSALGNDTPLFTQPTPASGQLPGELNVPAPIRRRSLEQQELEETSGKVVSGVPFYYGAGRSFQLWIGMPPQPVPVEQIIPTDLTDWTYRPLPGQIAVDPALGRIVFPPGQARKQNVRVSYVYGFSADMGGGEYDRPLSEPTAATIYRVGEGQTYTRINEALLQWNSDAPQHAVIEICDSGVYVEPVVITLAAKQSLQLRAANRKRPVLRLLNWETSLPDGLAVSGAAESWFILDGIIVTGRGVQVDGDVAGVTIRHSTLVPGWGLQCDCEPTRPPDPSLDLINAPDCVTIEHSIVGGIQVDRDEVREEPMRLRISDSIVDAISPEGVAVGAPGRLCAHVQLTVARSTVFGQIQTRSLELAENSIFLGSMRVCRRQFGCVRFCYIMPDSRTPRRYECQPDLVVRAVDDLYKKGDISAAEREALKQSESSRVAPEFNSVRYGTPTYCQLTTTIAVEISRGADDESEMGAFHDLYQPQRAANLRTRLDEYTPAGMNVGLIYAT